MQGVSDLDQGDYDQPLTEESKDQFGFDSDTENGTTTEQNDEDEESQRDSSFHLSIENDQQMDIQQLYPPQS